MLTIKDLHAAGAAQRKCLRCNGLGLLIHVVVGFHLVVVGQIIAARSIARPPAAVIGLLFGRLVREVVVGVLGIEVGVVGVRVHDSNVAG